MTGFSSFFRLVLLPLCVAILLAGCGSSSSNRAKSDLNIKGAPGWVNEGTRAVKNKRGRLIHGVGLSQGIPDRSLQINRADNRARAQIAEILSTYIDKTFSDYTQSTDNKVSNKVVRDLKARSSTLLAGSVIKARWRDKKSGDIYSLAELDRKRIDDFIESSNKLDEAFKSFYRQEASERLEDVLSATSS